MIFLDSSKGLKVQKIKIFVVTLITVLSTAAMANHLKEQSIGKRIAPAGSVYVEGDDVPVAKPAVAKALGPKAAAEDIYQASCSACHATDAIGAPKFGSAEAWKDRIAKGEEVLIANAIKGFNAMPPMGTCAACSDEDIANTVKYMVKNSR